MTKNTTSSLVEGTIFMAGITFLGGFMDAYTIMTRGGIFANNQTGNMAKLGIHFAQQNWKGVNECFFVMFCCVLGACFSQVVQHKLHWFQGDWRKRGLLLLAFALFLSGFVPTTIPHVYVGAAFTFLAGFQSCLFRKWEGAAHNTIVSTGNLRSIGLYLYDALDKNQNQEWSKLARYVMVAFSFAVGCAVGALVCTQMGIRASWLGSVIAITMALTLHQREKACVNL